VRPLLGLGAVVLVFAVIFVLFVMSTAPRGILDFAPPSGNFTGTTTLTTSFGYVCAASHIPGIENYAASSTTTLPGIGMQCSPELYGSLQVPVGPGIIAVWLVAFALALGSMAIYLNRKAKQKGPITT
jgi:hypothetical protein